MDSGYCGEKNSGARMSGSANNTMVKSERVIIEELMLFALHVGVDVN